MGAGAVRFEFNTDGHLADTSFPVLFRFCFHREDHFVIHVLTRHLTSLYD